MEWEKRIKKKGVSFKTKKLDDSSKVSKAGKMFHHETNQHLDPSVIKSTNLRIIIVYEQILEKSIHIF